MALGDRVSILGDPLPQTRPRPQQGLVGDLHRRHPGTRIVVEGEETGRRPLVDDNLRRPTRILRSARDSGDRWVHCRRRPRRAVRRRGEPPLGRPHRLPGRADRRGGDGLVHASELSVVVHRQGSIGATFGKLVQRELQRRQRGRLVDERRHQLGDERGRRSLRALRPAARSPPRVRRATSAGPPPSHHRPVPRIVGRRAADRRSRRAAWRRRGSGCRGP